MDDTNRREFLKSVVRSGAKTIVALIAVGSGISCAPAWISYKQRKRLEDMAGKTGYFAGFEGMQPVSRDKIKRIVEGIGRNLNMAAYGTSGNPSTHISIIEQAYENKKPIFIYGHSSGGNDARMLAVECREREVPIPVKILFLSDPTYLARPFPGKIPDNVERVKSYMSSDAGPVFGLAPKPENLENSRKTILSPAMYFPVDHLALPDAIKGLMMAEILGSR